MSVKLMLGDCLDRLAEISDVSVDLTVTSPPYDNLRTYDCTLNDWTQEKWQAVVRELFRVTKKGGVVVWIVGDATINGSETGTSFRQALFAMECGFLLHDTMIYQTSKPPMNSRRYQSCFEYMFVWSRGAPLVFNGLLTEATTAGTVVRKGTYYRADGTKKTRTGKERPVGAMRLRESIWRYVERPGLGHPAPFPERLASDHIVSWSNPGDLVLDPFLGSGTTGKMAFLLGRRFVGIERHPGYVALAERRINDAARLL